MKYEKGIAGQSNFNNSRIKIIVNKLVYLSMEDYLK